MLTGWNPFIPLDDKNSGIPCVILEYTLHNTSRRAGGVRVFLPSLAFGARDASDETSGSRNTVIPGKGVFLHNDEEPNAEAYGSASLTVIGERAAHQGNVAAQPRVDVWFVVGAVA